MYLAQQGEEPGKIQPRYLKGHSGKLMVAKLKANQKTTAAELTAVGSDLGVNRKQLPVLGERPDTKSFALRLHTVRFSSHASCKSHILSLIPTSGHTLQLIQRPRHLALSRQPIWGLFVSFS